MDTKGSNQSLVKITNQNLIIKEIRAHKRLSRSELAKILQLSNPSVSKHIDSLIAKGIVMETGSLVTDVGRRPIMLEFNGRHGCVAVVDMSSNDCRLCIADLLGNKLEYSRVEGGQTISAAVLGRIVSTLHEMLANIGDRCGKLLGICIGAPAVVEPVTGRLHWSGRIENYKETDLKKMFEDSFGVPVIVKNDINLAVVGERMYGAGSGIDNMMYVSIDAGVGQSVILGGNLFEGVHGVACDLGVIVPPIDPVIDAPSGESLMPYTTERRLSIYRLVDDVRALYDSGRNSIVREWASDASDLTYDDIVKAYGMSDPMVVSVVNRFARHVALMIKNLASLFDVELIILGGLVAKLGNPFLAEITSNIARFPGYSNPNLKLSKLFDTAVIFGGIEATTQDAIDRIIEDA